MSLEILFEYQHHQNYNEGAIPVHRHRWHVTLDIEESADNMDLISRSLLDSINKAVSPYQHVVLNDVFPFDRVRPTHENIANFLFNILDDILKPMQCRLKSINIAEDFDLINCVDHRCEDFDQLLTTAYLSATGQTTRQRSRSLEPKAESKPKLAGLAIGIPNTL